MKVLFVGPYPPPHGGISVHVSSAHARMKRAGLQSSVLNIDPRAPESDAYIKISGSLDFLCKLFRHVCDDWTLHVHTNGHNWKSWAITLVCGIAAQLGPVATLTLHSGMASAYVRDAPYWKRTFMRLACRLYGQLTCINGEIASAVADLGVAGEHIRISPAFSTVEPPRVLLPREIEAWADQHSPVIAATMFFRAEYGFDLLVEAASRLRSRHPRLGCLVMGTGENCPQASDLLARRRLTEVVRLAGDLDHDLCLALIARSTVFVRPTFCDGDSISVREALAFGVPVVASKVGTRPEGVLLFEAGDVNGLVQQLERVLAAAGGLT
jgi:glycosyltransferase involved in cell wall biosynthesis